MFYSQQGRGWNRLLTTTQLSLESGDRADASCQPVRACAVKVSAPASLRSENLTQDAAECSITTGSKIM